MTEDSPSRATHLTGPLFDAVHREAIFSDSKRFADAIPQEHPDKLARQYQEQRDVRGFDLREFVEQHFDIPSDIKVTELVETSESVGAHIHELWPNLRRPQVPQNEFDTLIALPNPHIVPGGRFREAYYWDSYFVAEGLAAIDRFDIIREMVENFAQLIERIGYVPNGNRTYYLGRSQLPVFSKMVELLAEQGDQQRIIEEFIPVLRAEYRFWMDGRGPGATYEAPGDRVIPVGGHVLNRYWDGSDGPRKESFREDLLLAQEVSPEHRPRLYRDIRAACESGWDFSSRWLADPDEFHSIHTTHLLPVDLNAGLWYLEYRLAEWLAEADQPEAASRYRQAALERQSTVQKHCWAEDAGFFFDYCWTDQTMRDRWTLAGMTPLFFGLATEKQAARVAAALESKFLRPGGLVTTLNHSPQQWDAPNGWAPMQWMAVHGLRRYGFDELANRVKSRWLATMQDVYARSGELVEKYNVVDPTRDATGGEYPPQSGFAWTNGIVVALNHEPRPGRVDHSPEPGPLDRNRPRV